LHIATVLDLAGCCIAAATIHSDRGEDIPNLSIIGKSDPEIWIQR
jgi:hypothetical protein